MFDRQRIVSFQEVLKPMGTSCAQIFTKTFMFIVHGILKGNVPYFPASEGEPQVAVLLYHFCQIICKMFPGH